MHTSLSVYLDESRNYATMTFCGKNFLSLILERLFYAFYNERRASVARSAG